MMIDYIFDDGGRAAAGYRGDTGDCVVRAIAIAGAVPYRHAYDAMAEAMAEHGYSRSGNAYILSEQRRKAPRRRGQRKARDVQRLVVEEFGFQPVQFTRGPRPTYTEAHAEHGTCIVKTTKHVAALRDGALRDTFDGRTYTYDEIAGERKAMTIWIPV